MLLKFVRTFHPDFAYPDTIENLVDIQSKIKKFNYTVTDNVFNNNTSNIGVSFLKSSFKSYWHSKYNKNQKTPVEVWHDDEFMKKVIEYRIGCNTSNEIFDFSLHQLLRGISAYRHTISFFKPIVAANIYKHFLGDIDAPIVIDPCAGFGGRLLGFKSMYPNGTYIGIEPNIDTFNELQELAKNFTNVELYNCKLEEYTGSKECDLAFTSIPYFDTEIYSNHVRYDSIDSWQREFIGSLLTYNNLVVNMSPDIETLFPEPKGKMYLQNQTSHFNKNSKSKLEPILVY
jgi:tRNA G46 methylase TrmB